MIDVMGVILTSKSDFALRELTSRRSVTALPVASRYRMVDFMLSNLVNSGVRNVGVIAQGNYHSLMDHIEGGKEWDLHTRNNGLFMLPPLNAGTYEGAVDALKANFDYLRRSRQKEVLLVGGRYFYSTTYDEMFAKHEESGADITVLNTKYDPQTYDYTNSSDNDRSFISVGVNGIVNDIQIDPNVVTMPNVLMDCILIKRTLLIQLIDAAASRGQHHINKDILRQIIKDQNMKVVGCEYTGYCRRIETIKSYFNMNMDLLKKEVRKEVLESNPVYTKTRDDAPALYLPGSSVKNSLVADGCIIEGSIENCVIFRGVKIGKGSVIKNAIIMQDTVIGHKCELEHVILDKDVTVMNEDRLIGNKQYPIVIGKGVTL